MTAQQCPGRGRATGPWVALAVVLALAGGILLWMGLQERPPEETPEPREQYSYAADEAIEAARAGPDEFLEIPEAVRDELGPHVRTEPVPVEPAATSTPTEGSAPASPAGPDSTGVPDDGAAPAGFAHHLQIPSIYVDAPVVAGGVSSDNVMLLPSDLGAVGLLDTVQPLRAQEGATVIAGHVTYNGTHGVLYYLGEVRPGATVQTWDDGGARQEWVVSGVRMYRQGDLPDEMFDTAGERRLYLVTCGGEIVQTSRGWLYSDNIVVTAVPLDAG